MRMMIVFTTKHCKCAEVKAGHAEYAMCVFVGLSPSQVVWIFLVGLNLQVQNHFCPPGGVCDREQWPVICSVIRTFCSTWCNHIFWNISCPPAMHGSLKQTWKVLFTWCSHVLFTMLHFFPSNRFISRMYSFLCAQCIGRMMSQLQECLCVSDALARHVHLHFLSFASQYVCLIPWLDDFAACPLHLVSPDFCWSWCPSWMVLREMCLEF